jgi:hypothetical protein
VELLNSAISVGGGSREAWGNDGTVPTWQRRGRRLVGGLKGAGRGGRPGDGSNGGCLP